MKRCALACLLCLAGCSNPAQSMMYQIPVHQGAFFEPEVLAQLKTSMDQQAVVALLGTPTLHDPFHPYRVDYLYTAGTQDTRTKTQYHTLIFDRDEKLRRVHPPV